MKKKQILSVITFAVLLFGINMLSVRAEMLSGTCGNNLMWMIDEEGIFTIIGNGDIPDAWSYENGEYTSGFIPWGRYKNIIKTVVIENGVNLIGNGAFESCRMLTNVTISDSVIAIGDGVFRNCPNLSVINVSSGNNAYASAEGVLLNKSKTELITYPSGCTNTSYVIPDSIMTIKSYAFNGCNSLENIMIGNGVTTIESEAIFACGSLNRVMFNGTKTEWEKVKVGPDNILPTVTFLKASITYNLNGGTGSFPEQIKSFGEPITLHNTIPTKTGYSFLGWGVTEDGDVKYSAGTTYSTDKDAILYAVWKPNTYTISYNANGGEGATASSTHTYDVYGVLSTNTFTKTGYTFRGWATTQAGTTIYTDGAAVLNLTSEQNGNINLYAVWEVNTYSVYYDANGGNGIMTSSAFVYDTEGTLKLNIFTRLGYTYAGWATSPNGNVVYSDEENVINLSSEMNGTVNLYAIWRANTYTITYHANDGSETNQQSNHTYDVESKLMDNIFLRIGYIFRGWSTTSTGSVIYTDEQSVMNITPVSNGIANLYAVWEPGCELYVNGNIVTFKSQQPICGKIIVGLYNKDGKMKDIQSHDAVDGINVNFSNLLTGDYSKIMCWESITSAKPMFEQQRIILK